MAEAVAKAAGVPPREVRRALTLHGDLAGDGRIALDDGGERAASGHAGGRPPARAHARRDRARRPRRAREDRPRPPSSGSSTAPASRCTGRRRRRESSPARSTTSPTRLPEVVAPRRALPARRRRARRRGDRAQPDGRPDPFQVTGRAGSRRDRGAREVPLSVFFFDVLHVDGEDLLDVPLRSAAAQRPAVPDAGRRGSPPDDRAGRTFDDAPSPRPRGRGGQGARLPVRRRPPRRGAG